MSDKKIVSQATLKELQRRRVIYDKAAEAAEEAKQAFAVLENQVLRDIDENGCKVAPGKLMAFVELFAGACRPPWKELYLEHMKTSHDIDPKAKDAELRLEYPAPERKRLVVGKSREPA